MNDKGKMIWLAVLGMVLTGWPAMAHKVKCFAVAEGEVISGYAWLGGGGRPQNVPYRVLGPDGATLLEGQTNQQGEFSFAPKQNCDHLIVVEAAVGHEARFLLKAADLPAHLTSAPEPEGAPSPRPPSPENSASPLKERTYPAGLEEAIARAVGEQIAPLRKQLAQFAERQRLQDIVAGLGYIAGLAGASLYFAGRRTLAGKAKTTPPPTDMAGKRN